eukprot:TRINITY_DN2520_c0_g2_i1.p1 TRINITY_DN2520_c0_g2~~TRINITY_DN2520_c0_g2_i1.p1  ORF type:complete len:405 (+),score=164.57 TRINITY_DN2520_c0_g2_i1:73-1287(+)
MEGLDNLKVSDEKKKYIVELVNPVLEEMVAECIHQMPADPVPFMLEWLELKMCNDEDKRLTPEERERMAAENKSLKENVNKVTQQMQEAMQLAAAEKPQAEEDEEEEDDADDEPPPGFFDEKPQSTKARQSVSAEAYGEWNAKKAFVPPLIPKTDEQKDRLRSCLCKSFLFSNLDANDLTLVIGAMKEVSVESGKRVINQGENGDFLSVIESGKLDCLIKADDGSEKTVKTCTAGDVFGELALLYNCPRAASVQASEKCVLWQLDRDTFNHIVKEAAQKKRNRYDAFLTKVPLLQSMDAYERSQLADALKVENIEANKNIVTAGEAGTKFYIIEEGSAAATKNGAEVMVYNRGDYFGELALIQNKPRAATVVAKTACTLLSIDSGSFKRLLNIDELLSRATKYT